MTEEIIAELTQLLERSRDANAIGDKLARRVRAINRDVSSRDVHRRAYPSIAAAWVQLTSAHRMLSTSPRKYGNNRRRTCFRRIIKEFRSVCRTVKKCSPIYGERY
jgi:hypothetical protein